MDIGGPSEHHVTFDVLVREKNLNTARPEQRIKQADERPATFPALTMENQKKELEKTENTATALNEEQRSYAGYFSGGDLTFDPMKDLNLPGSYEEVLSRFEKLQGERAVEVVN